jgi:heavy metal translocating P-type ATPase
MQLALARMLREPYSEYVLSSCLFVALVLRHFVHGSWPILLVVSVIGAVPTTLLALRSIAKLKISIDVYNTFALLISFATGFLASAGFIGLMLSFARLLDWYTETRTSNAVEELLKLKPSTAVIEKDGRQQEVKIDRVKKGDTVVITTGARVPVDGTVIYGEAHMNEASVTGESALIVKVVGDRVLSATFCESGVVKIRATHVGKDSTIERMASLMKDAAKNKSRGERLADRFATVFMPIVGLIGLITYLVTGDILMTASLFLVACADDMAVAIPLAMTASLGQAAKRGVIVKGGEWLDVLASLKTLVFDKTGTLTYGSLAIKETIVEPGVGDFTFWNIVGIAEKYTEHPVGRAIFREAVKHVPNIPDPESYEVVKGIGVIARYRADVIAVGNEKILSDGKMARDAETVCAKLATTLEKTGLTSIAVMLNGSLIGQIVLADVPREEAKQSIAALHHLGVERILMFTGDNEQVAKRVSTALGVTDYRAAMSPEDKLRAVETLDAPHPVGMVGDGINDAPTLARADLGIAMGGGGTAVAVEAADVVILTDDLSRLPEMIRLGRRTRSVIRGDMLIWFVSNMIGFALVFTGIAGPALAAFYNFATDFFPLINSSRLFRGTGRGAGNGTGRQDVRSSGVRV